MKVVCFTIVTGLDQHEDSFEVFDFDADAEKRYKNLLQINRLHCAGIANIEKATEPHWEDSFNSPFVKIPNDDEPFDLVCDHCNSGKLENRTPRVWEPSLNAWVERSDAADEIFCLGCLTNGVDPMKKPIN